MRVAILGCGYVGCELAGQLTSDGHEVVGVRRSADGAARVRETGAEAVRADVTDADAMAALPRADAVVFAASSGGGDAAAAREVFVEGVEAALDAFGGREEPPASFVYASSTGVYGDRGGDWVDEGTPTNPTTPKTRVLAEAEAVTRERAAEYGIDATVVRFAGLYGPGRYRLERYLTGPVTEGVLNMLHRVDAAGALRVAMETAAETVLAVDDEPVAKWAFADWLADAAGVPRPERRTREERLAAADLSPAAERRLRTSKRCSNRLLRSLGYEFAYPTFREGYRDSVAAYRREQS